MGPYTNKSFQFRQNGRELDGLEGIYLAAFAPVARTGYIIAVASQVDDAWSSGAHLPALAAIHILTLALMLGLWWTRRKSTSFVH